MFDESGSRFFSSTFYDIKGNPHYTNTMNFNSLILSLISAVLSVSPGGKEDKYVSGNNTDQAAALQFLENYNDEKTKLRYKSDIAEWNQWDNSTADEELQEFEKEAWKNATSFAWKDFKDTNKTAYRMFKKLSSIQGILALPKEKFEEFFNVTDYMFDQFHYSRLCVTGASPDERCDPSDIEPELIEFCTRVRDNEELLYTWCEWRNGSGLEWNDKYNRYVELSNEAAKLNGFSDMGEMWTKDYESEDFKGDLEELLQTLMPLYEQLHAYVRQKLRKLYPLSGIKADGPIPAHLLEDMSGQGWIDLFDRAAPYPEKMYPDISETMKKKNITQLDMVKMSDDFFSSLGLIKMPPEFWHGSIFVQPKDKHINCHGTAWDFSNGKDFRIVMCAEVNMEDLQGFYHEMGHIEYMMQYAKQPVIFRDAANPGFHEAVGDAIFLSAATPEHLKKVGILDEVFDEKETEINELFRTSLSTVPFAPLSYLFDAWRWKVFDGRISAEELNEKWWEMSLQYRGVCPPVRRTNEDFDPAFNVFVAECNPHIRYFVANVIEFQFHKALCEAAGHQGPLHKCNIYNSKSAGKLLSNMLRKGSSEHWEEAMSTITNGKSRKMDATPMLEYFAPLMDWLKEQNKNETLGWKSSDPMICP